MESRKFDIAIVGAGPGGLIAAIEGAKRGFRVYVVDKKSVIGVPVRCGEYLPTRTEMQNLLPQAVDAMDLFDVPEEAVSNRCTKIRFISPYGEPWEFTLEANIVDRRILEQSLAETGQSMGVALEVKKNAIVRARDGGWFVGNNSGNGVWARVVIGADGFPSTVADAAGLFPEDYKMNPMSVAINYQYHMEEVEIEDDVTEMYMGMKVAPGGYAWIIPKGHKTANVGVGIRTPYSGKKDGRAYLEYFIDSCELSKPRLESAKKYAMIADVLPVDGPIPKTYGDNVLLVGDAAGMVMPTNGGGIATALITGRYAGQVACDYLEGKSPLSAYEEIWTDRIGKAMIDSTRLRRMADRFMRRDFLFHLLLKLLRASGIKDVITCRVPGRLAPFARFY